jgi:calcineurin-like phosphoesterase family protein
MTQVFIISDTHFGHASTFEKFKNADGTPLRPFTSIEEMNETMVDRWNAKVSSSSIVYHLGDVVMDKKYLPIVGRLNGIKRLVHGNHDNAMDELPKYFKRIYGVKVLDEMILSHIPLHPDSIGRFGTNVHGHLHDNEVMRDVPAQTNPRIVTHREIDPRYLCVSVEHTNYEPLSLEEVRERISKRRVQYNHQGPVAWGNGSNPG